jgi:hypothetical protein
MFTPKDVYALEGTIFKEFYKKFGDKAIPVIEQICKEMGSNEGANLKTKRNLANMDVRSAAVYLGKEYFTKEMGDYVKVEIKSPNEIHWKVPTCSLGFKTGDKEVCLAVMKGDEAMLNALCNGQARLTVRKAVAFGDKMCDILITKKI